MSITREIFGTTECGDTAYLYRLENADGAYVTITSFGCRIVSICVPDRDGKLRDVCLGYDTLAEYEHDAAGYGAVVGRFANRIGRGEFTLDGITYHLALNDGPNHLHGGKKGFHYYNWDSQVTGDALIFTRVSPDGEEGYPGTLTMTAEYRWSDDNELSISYRAETDAPTVFNTTNHAYFNLSGEDAATGLDQILTINAAQFTEADEHTLVTGKILDVEGTPFDFRKAKPVGQDIHSDYYQTAQAGTYDHNFVLSGSGAGLTEAAVLHSEKSGICMTCFTDQPGLQLYVPPISPSASGKGGKVYPPFDAVCLETQDFPDAPNQPDFPSSVIRPGEPFVSKTIYCFAVR